MRYQKSYEVQAETNLRHNFGEIKLYASAMNKLLLNILRFGSVVTAPIIYYSIRVALHSRLSNLEDNIFWLVDSGYEITIPYIDISIIVTVFGFLLISYHLYKTTLTTKTLFIVSIMMGVTSIIIMSLLAALAQGGLGFSNITALSAVPPIATITTVVTTYIITKE